MEEGKKKKRTSLKSILGGDILATDFFRRQTKLLVLIMVFIIFYIHNRYASQQQQIEIDRLKKELIDIKYDALTRSSELMEKSRQSRIEDYISSKEYNDPLFLRHPRDGVDRCSNCRKGRNHYVRRASVLAGRSRSFRERERNGEA